MHQIIREHKQKKSETFVCKSDEQVLSEHAVVSGKHCNMTNITNRVGVSVAK